jgi:hypothetical protein
MTTDKTAAYAGKFKTLAYAGAFKRVVQHDEKHGHTLVLGPSRTGKSYAAALLGRLRDTRKFNTGTSSSLNKTNVAREWQQNKVKGKI